MQKSQKLNRVHLNAKRYSLNASSCGFGLMEIVIAVGIIGTALFSIMTLSATALEFNRRILDSTRAGFLLEEGSEAMRMMRDADWSNISGMTAGAQYYITFADNKWATTTTASSIDGIYYRTVSISPVFRDENDDIALTGTPDEGTMKISESVSWWNGRATSTRNMVFYLTDLFGE